MPSADRSSFTVASGRVGLLSCHLPSGTFTPLRPICKMATLRRSALLLNDAPAVAFAHCRRFCSCGTMMRAMRVHKHGGPTALQLDSVPVPALSADTQVVVDVERAGLNFIDTYFRTGLYGSADDLPIILGKEAAGVVVDAGAASGVAVGTRVACLVGSGRRRAARLSGGARCTTSWQGRIHPNGPCGSTHIQLRRVMPR